MQVSLLDLVDAPRPPVANGGPAKVDTMETPHRRHRPGKSHSAEDAPVTARYVPRAFGVNLHAG